MKKAVIYSDGASSGNPGPSGIGVVIQFGHEHYEFSAYIGNTTNNVAEYSALIRGLEEARELGAQEIEAYMDSELVAKQLSGKYKVKHPGLIPLFQKAMKLVSAFKRVTFTHVPREQNKHADRLSKKAVEQAPKDCQPPPEPGKLF